MICLKVDKLDHFYPQNECKKNGKYYNIKLVYYKKFTAYKV
jgi:hypothetical protein